MRAAAALLVVALVALPTATSAHPHPRAEPSWRDRWYIGFGLGTGAGSYVLGDTRVNYRDTHGAAGSPFQLAYQLELGATLTPRLLLGGELSGLTSHASSDQADSTLYLTQLLTVLTWFPAERGPFLRAGGGFAWISQDWDTATAYAYDSAGGLSVLGGLGYAWWLGRHFNLTLHADASAQWYGSGYGDPSSSAGVNAYLGFRWY